jgi:hypothetical protein
MSKKCQFYTYLLGVFSTAKTRFQAQGGPESLISLSAGKYLSYNWLQKKTGTVRIDIFLQFFHSVKPSYNR